jgi:ankyrin repeat protein
MFPNPQGALPLPPRPSVDHYKKLAKDLVKACKADRAAADPAKPDEPVAVRAWATRWLEALAELQIDAEIRQGEKAAFVSQAEEVAQFARQRMLGGAAGGAEHGESGTAAAGSGCVLADAQFVIARAHGFPSWPKFVTEIEALARMDSRASAFEAAAVAVIRGDVATLTRLLREHPELSRARSAREHRATLLHYVSANGVEGYRQISPKNAAEITQILLDAGAEVDAGADVYHGNCTALGLVATSSPPHDAGVQIPVIDVLLEHGARMDLPDSAGNAHSLLHACLANGQPEAAAYLLDRGAPVDLVGTAGLGRLDLVRGFFDEDGALRPPTTPAQLAEAFKLACGYGRLEVVEFLLDHGLDVDAGLTGYGAGHTGLHVAAYHAHVEIVRLLLRRGARIDAIDKTWKTPPLVWALTGWTQLRRTDPARYYDTVAMLVAAGASVTPDLLSWDKLKDDPRMRAALTGAPPPA